MMSLSKADLQRLMGNLKNMSTQEMLEALTLLEEIEKRKRLAMCQSDFLAFIAHIDTTYKFGSHLKRLGNLLMQIEDGAKDRIAVSMPPRFGKSQMISIYYPAWYLGKHPDHKVIMASHTADLAVDMARKVRNLMQSDLYQEIFPNVKIAADAKAAGKWNTTKGGEVFACIELATPVLTPSGYVRADSLSVGSYVLVGTERKSVEAVYKSVHRSTIRIDGVGFSEDHPVWTANRGWVPAKEVNYLDTLWVENFYDRLMALLKGAMYGYLEHPHVSSLVQHKISVHKPKKRKMAALRGAWDHLMRTVEGLRQLCAGYGVPSNPGAYRGPYRQQWAIQSGKLSVGNSVGAIKQQIKQLGGFWGYHSPARSKFKAIPSSAYCTSAPRDASGISSSTAKAFPQEFQTYGAPKNHGWRGSRFARWFGRCWFGREPREPASWIESCVEGCRKTTEIVQGLLLGVRRPIKIVVETHPPKQFVNYRIENGDVFYAGGILTHNCGVGGALAGRGAHLAIVDDPLSEQDLKAGNTASLDVVYEWFRAGLRTRLMPGARLAILHTRWHQRDLIGRLTKDAALNPDADQYEIFEFPAILEYPNPIADPESQEYDPEASSVLQKSLWPEQWTLESLLRTKASMPAWQWNAQYQQSPTAQEAAIIKRDDIKWWTKEDPPSVDYTVQSWDTALTTKDRSDYSVCQTWGVWTNEDGVDNVILLNSVRGKYEFPELKRMAMQQYKDWTPDTVIIETKASGQPLVDEMRRSGIYVQEFSPGKGQDKLARVNAISDMFTSGQVWFPETWWASEVVDELLAFPAGEHDDAVDACTLALMRIRKGGLLRLNSDVDTDDDYVAVRRAYY